MNTMSEYQYYEFAAIDSPLNEAQALAMEQLIDRVRRAGRIAQWVRPAGYDGEVVCLLAMLQNLGRLVVGYHCADEAAQVDRLMRPAPSTEPGQPDEPGMSEEAASFAVLGARCGSGHRDRERGHDPARARYPQEKLRQRQASAKSLAFSAMVSSRSRASTLWLSSSTNGIGCRAPR